MGGVIARHMTRSVTAWGWTAEDGKEEGSEDYQQEEQQTNNKNVFF